MKYRLLIIILLIISLTACRPASQPNTPIIGSGEIAGSGINAQEEQAIKGVSGIRMEIFGEVEILIGTQEIIRIDGEENLLPYLDIRQENGILIISTQRNTRIKQTKPIQFQITLKELQSVDVASSAVVQVNGPLKARALNLVMSGSGEINLPECELDSMSVQIPGSGLVSAAGQAARQEIKIDGSGRFDGENLIGSAVVVSLSGSGTSVVNASDTLLATISGSGEVSYLGNPSIDQKITGPGTLQAMPAR